MNEKYKVYTEQIGYFRSAWLGVDELLTVIENRVSLIEIPKEMQTILKDLRGKNRLLYVVTDVTPPIDYPLKSEPEIQIKASEWNQVIDFGNTLHDLGTSLSNLQYAWSHLKRYHNYLSSEMMKQAIGPQTILDQLIEY